MLDYDTSFALWHGVLAECLSNTFCFAFMKVSTVFTFVGWGHREQHTRQREEKKVVEMLAVILIT